MTAALGEISRSFFAGWLSDQDVLPEYQVNQLLVVSAVWDQLGGLVEHLHLVGVKSKDE